MIIRNQPFERDVIRSIMGIVSFQVNIDLQSISLYVNNALRSTGFACLLGSRMFLNLMEAGRSDVNNGSNTSTQSSEECIASDLQFVDNSDPDSGKYTLYITKSESLTSIR